MKRESQVRFCLLCKHREWNSEEGVICGLTYQRAVFEEKCDTFELDIPEKERIIQEKIKYYDLEQSANAKENEHIRFLELTNFFFPQHVLELPPKFHINKSIIKFIFKISFPLFFCLMAARTLYTNGINNLILAILVIVLAILSWLVFDFFFRKTTFSISEKGINYGDDFFSWQVILGVVVREKVYQGSTERVLIIFLPTAKDLEIKLNGLIATSKIENAIILYREVFEGKGD